MLVSMPMKGHCLGFPRIGRDSRFDLRSPGYGARKVADFLHFKMKSGRRITGRGLPVLRPRCVASFPMVCQIRRLRKFVPPARRSGRTFRKHVPRKKSSPKGAFLLFINDNKYVFKTLAFLP